MSSTPSQSATETTAGSPPPAVELSGITKRFGDIVACDSIDFTLEDGSVHALIGENGAGKTTLMKTLYGVYTPDAGTIRVAGEPVTFGSPRDANDAGIGMIHQHFMLIDPMTVLQNIVLGHEPKRRFAVDTDRARERITELSERYDFGIESVLDRRIENLGVGLQQRVEIVKTLYRGADVIILDEPTAVLTPQEVQRLYSVIADLRAEGHSIIFITHKLEEAMTAADSITVLRDGKAVGTVSTDDTSRQELARMMVGRDVLFDVEMTERTAGEEVLRTEDLVVGRSGGIEAVSEVSFDVQAGEIFGIAGVEGNGQRELIEAVTGLRAPTAGRILLDGEDVTALGRRELIERGMSYIPEDRQERGLVMSYDLVENALLGNQSLPEFLPGWLLDWGRTREHATDIVEQYDVNPRDVDAISESLSGGNQQKFIVGREFERDPQFIVASQPTRGVDVGSIEYIHQRLVEMRDAGTAILLVSSKLEEVQKLSDRLSVMYEGELVETLDPASVTEEELGLLMAGESRDDTVEEGWVDQTTPEAATREDDD